jgi:transforming growth factor-beta-induced protein
MKTFRRTLAASLAVAAASLAFAAAHTSATTVPPDDSAASDCSGVDPASIADLSVHEAAAELEDLSMMTAAVAASSLDDQLAGDGPFTIFAPSNAAISEIPTNVLDSMLADPALLDSILSYHVVVGEALPADMLVGDVETLNGTLTIAMDGETVVINDGEATVVCPDIVTANATIHIIDHVLQPVGDAVCPGGSTVPGSAPLTSAPMTSAPGSSVPC